MSVEDIIAKIEKLNVLELVELTKSIQEKWGVSAAPVAAAAAPAAGGGAAEAAPVAEEQTAFDVILTDFGAEKVKVIRTVREITGLGLKESKDLVESAPAAIKEGVNKEEAESIKAKLIAEGAKAEVK